MTWFDLRKGLLILFVIVLPLLSINIQNKTWAWYAKPFTVTVSYMQNLYSGFTQNIKNTTSLYLNLVNIKKENSRLRKEILKMQVLQVKLTETQIENDRLEQLLNFKNDVESESLVAKVIASDLLFGTHSTIRVNRGRQDGLHVGLSAITPLGVVGVVFHVEESFSDILVLTDSFSTIDAIVQRSRVRGLIIGNRGANCMLQYLKRTDDVQKGDLIITTGLDDIFPKGIPIGHVIKVQKGSYGITQQVEVQPLVNPHHLEELLIVLKPHSSPQTQPPLKTTQIINTLESTAHVESYTYDR